MRPRKFVFKEELTPADFETSLLWAGYYEPDEVDKIVSWGFDEAEVRAALQAADWQDGWMFPLPLEAKDTEWFRGKMFAVEATTAAGITLPGWLNDTQNSGLELFLGASRYALVHVTAAKLLGDLGGPTPQPDAFCQALRRTDVYPLTVLNLATAETFSFTPNLVHGPYPARRRPGPSRTPE